MEAIKAYCDEHWEEADCFRPTPLSPVAYGNGLAMALTGFLRKRAGLVEISEVQAYLAEHQPLCCAMDQGEFDACLDGYLDRMLAYLADKDPHMPRG